VLSKQIVKFFSSLTQVSETTSWRSSLPKGSVKIEGVSKSFRRVTSSKKSYSSVKSEFLNIDFLKNLKLKEKDQNSENELTALRDVSFEIKPGSSLGVVGRNGSGKSTLLKLIAGIYHADKGSVDISGRVSALIELGAGFHPDFSGRENVYLAGIMYGLSRKEIDSKFDDIVSFAELEDFIDDPVRTYSSGMYMRLGFSVAAHTDPDILLVDEVLAVGDAAFINRCHDTISEFRRLGKTLIFVTHDLSSVARWCDEAIWLDKGDVKLRGEPKRVIDAYLQGVEDKHQEDLERDNQVKEPSAALDRRNASDKRWGKGEVELSNIRISKSGEESKWLFTPDDEVVVEVDYQINKAIDDLCFGIGITRADGLDVHGKNTEGDDCKVPLPEFSEQTSFPLKGTYRYSIDRLSLLPGTYFLDVAAHRVDGYPYDYHHQLHKFSVRGDNQGSGVFCPVSNWEIVPDYKPAQEKA